MPLTALNRLFPFARNPQVVREVLTWGLPPLAIPTMRYLQDPPESRKQLFVRDASTYVMGAAIYFLVGRGSLHLFNRFKVIPNLVYREMTAFLLGLTANLLYAGVGAVHFSHWVNRQWLSDNKPKASIPPSVTPYSYIPLARRTVYG